MVSTSSISQNESLAGYTNKVTAIEDELGIKTSRNIFNDILPKTLTNAAEMFLYLYICPHFPNTESVVWFQRWSGFYNELFKTSATDHILLTLNRMLKQEVVGNTQGKVESVLKTTATLLLLKFEQIRSILPGSVS